MDHTTGPNVVVDVAPAPAHDLTEKSDRRSVPDIPGSQTETPKRRLLVHKKTHDEPSPNLRPGAPVSSWMMGCSFDARLKRYKEPPALVGK